ncbi:MAG: hypothetical protein GTN99_01200, partial [Candidatus Dadabacteria bacterium]|nr:hypothetical protein [Candidatus Dadabacteria bacterium]NIT12894.1 hypothetical protein [Candidatus Dadabacteria bacterium]
MKFTIILFINLLLCSAAAKSYAGLQELYEVRRAFYTMGTTLEFNLVCSDKEHCLNIINSCIAEVRRIDKVFSNYRDDSELSMLQITADKKIKVSKEFFELTAFSHFISVLTNGGFDITVGPLVNLWKTDSFKNKIPKESVIKSALDRCVGFNKFNLSSADNSISFNSDCINLDFGAIGKGYVLE